MKKLTKAEETLMKYLWNLGKGFMKDITEQFPEPRPAYTTIATTLAKMVQKGFVGYHQHGNVREYYPRFEKSEYFSHYIGEIIENFYGNSAKQFASFFARETNLTIEELEELKKLIDQELTRRKDKA
jgi:predicted transcriptional regulator